MYKDKIIKVLESPALSDIWKWSKTCHGKLLVICLLNFIISGSSLVITVATRGLIDGATSRNGGQVRLYAVILVLAVLLIRAAMLLSGFLKSRTNALLLKDMRTMLLTEILHKQYAALNGYHSGELVNRMFSDISIVRAGVTDIVPGLVSMAVSFLGAVLILLKMDWRFVAVLSVGGSLGLVFAVLVRRPMKLRHKAVQESEGKLHASLQEMLGNLRLIKASGSEARMKQQADVLQNDLFTAQLKKGYFSACMNSGMNLVFHMGWLFCMLWGCMGIYQGRLTYGMLAAIIQLVGQIQGPIAAVAELAAQAYGTVSSAERLKELIGLPDEIRLGKTDGNALYRELTQIRLRDLVFSYGRGSENVLEHVSCTIRPGDFVAVTGVSGGGKSTLFLLLLGIYQPCGGTLSFCFQDGSCETASGKLRSLFAYVPQGNTLFSGTLRENLTMFTDTATDEEIMQAAGLACIDRLILRLEDGLETVIGEHGIGLSEGQAQRIAVARALLSRAPILLLDESTSALDEATEARLLQNISSFKDKTCLIVTHRKAALSICDYRLHIENASVRKLKLASSDMGQES